MPPLTRSKGKRSVVDSAPQIKPRQTRKPAKDFLLDEGNASKSNRVNASTKTTKKDVRHSSSSSVDTHQGLSEFCAKHLDLRIDTSNRLSVTERGEVYKAVDLESRVVVVVKVLIASNPRLEAKFRFELDSQKRIPPHENIVGLLNTRIEAVEPLKLTRMYIVTEYCNGGTLDAYLRANPLEVV